MVGPRIGSAIIPSPQNAIALPRSSTGNASSSTACDNGTRLPPVMPCTTRKKISQPSVGAIPHSRLDTVNPVTTVISSRLRPK